jgi:hypothetical protein
VGLNQRGRVYAGTNVVEFKSVIELSSHTAVIYGGCLQSHLANLWATLVLRLARMHFLTAFSRLASTHCIGLLKAIACCEQGARQSGPNAHPLSFACGTQDLLRKRPADSRAHSNLFPFPA